MNWKKFFNSTQEEVITDIHALYQYKCKYFWICLLNPEISTQESNTIKHSQEILSSVQDRCCDPAMPSSGKWTELEYDWSSKRPLPLIMQNVNWGSIKQVHNNHIYKTSGHFWPIFLKILTFLVTKWSTKGFVSNPFYRKAMEISAYDIYISLIQINDNIVTY